MVNNSAGLVRVYVLVFLTGFGGEDGEICMSSEKILTFGVNPHG